MKIVSPIMNVTKQLGKHTLTAVWDEVKSYNTNLTTLANDAKEIQDTVIKHGRNATEIFNEFKTGNAFKRIHDWFFESETEFGEYDLAGGDDDFDAGFQIDNGLDDGEEDKSSSEILSSKSMKDITRGQVGAMYKIGGKQVEAAAINASEIIASINTRSSEIVASINTVNNSLGSIQKKLDQLITLSPGFVEEKKREPREEGLIDYNGQVTLGSAIKGITKELSGYTDILDTFKTIFTMSSPSALLQMPLGMLNEHKFKKLGNRSIDDIATGFNEYVGSIIDESLRSLLSTDFVSRYVDVNSGHGNRDYSRLVKNQYTTDVAKFDGITRQSIVEIIPGYLKKITESLSGETYEINERGHLTTDKVDTFSGAARVASSASLNGRARDLVNKKMHNDSITDFQKNQAYKVLVTQYVAYMHQNGLAFLPPEMLDNIGDRMAMVEAARDMLDEIDPSTKNWFNICNTIMTVICDDMRERSKFANVVAANTKRVDKGLTERAKTTTRPQDVRRIEHRDYFAGLFDAKYQQEKYELEQSYSEKIRELEEAQASGTGITGALKGAAKSKVNQTRIDKLKKEYEEKLEELENAHEAERNQGTDVSQNKSSVSKVKAGFASMSELTSITQNIFDLLSGGINVRIVSHAGGSNSGRKQIPSRVKPPIATIGYAGDVPEHAPIPRGDTVVAEMPFDETMQLGQQLAESAHRKYGMFKLADNSEHTYRGTFGPTTVSDISKVASTNADVKLSETGATGFMYSQKSDSYEGANVSVQSSERDKNLFDWARTMIQSALSNGNGNEDLQDIRQVINQIKDPDKRNMLLKNLKGMMDRNSAKDANDPNVPAEKKPGILGGLFSGLLGNASKLFGPITALLKPVTSLVKVIAKPLINLAKKGFKSGANDIKAGAKQIWDTFRGSREHSDRKKSAKSSDDSDDDGGSHHKTHETTDADLKRKEEQQLQPLDYNKTQSYRATTATVQSDSTSKSFTFIPGMAQTEKLQPTEVKGFGQTTTPTDSGTTGGTEGAEGAQVTAKGGGKLASVMGGLTKMLGGVGKIILTLIMSLSAVKVVIELVKKTITAGIKPLNKAIRRLTTAIKPVLKTISKLTKQISEFVVNIVDSLMKVINPLMEILQPVLESIMVALNPLLASVMSILNVVTATLEPLMPIVDMLLKNASSTLTMVAELINDFVQPFVETVQPILEELSETLGPFMTEVTSILEPIREAFLDTVIKVITPQFGLMKNTLVPVVEYIANNLKVGIGVIEIGLGGVISAIGTVVSGLGHFTSLFSTSRSTLETTGDEMRQSGRSLIEDGKSNVSSGIDGMRSAISSFWDNLIHPKLAEPVKQEITPTTAATTAAQQRAVSGGSILDGVVGSGNPMDQHSYGSFMNMSERGCGPVALADVIARRTGSGVDAASLAVSMAGSGAYNVNRGTSIGGFVNTANALGLDMQVGGVTTNSLRYATPDNPITVIGSGTMYGTHQGNNHYVNVLGTDGSGMAYVSNPLTGKIERHSTAALAASSLAGLYGSGDVSISLSDIVGDAVVEAFDELKSMAGNLLGLFSSDTGIGTSIDEILNGSNTQSAASKVKQLLTEAEIDQYTQQARAQFEKDFPRKDGESDTAYEKRWKQNADAYLVAVTKDIVSQRERDNSQRSLTFANSYQTNSASTIDALNSGMMMGGSSGNVAQIIPLVIKAYEAAGIVGKSGDYNQSGKYITLNINGKQLKERPDCTGLADSVIDAMGYNSEKMNSAAFNAATGIKDMNGNFSTDWTLGRNPEISSLQQGDIVIIYDGNKHHGEIVSGVQGNRVYGWNYGSEDGMRKSLNAVNLQLQGMDPLTATMNASSVINGHKRYSRVIRYVGNGTQSSYGQYIGSTGASLGSGTTEEKIWYYLTNSLGFTKAGAAGVMGNLIAESVMRPNNLEDEFNKRLGMTDEQYTQAVDNGSYSRAKFVSDHTKANCGAGYGLPQFTWYTLKAKLYDNAKSKGTSIADIGTQLDTIAQSVDSGLLSTLRSTNSIKEASDAWLYKYEKPAEKTNNSIKRAKSAEAYYAKYANWTPTAAQITASSYTKNTPANGTVFQTKTADGKPIFGEVNTSMIYKATGSGDVNDTFGSNDQLMPTLMSILMNILSSPTMNSEDYEMASMLYDWMLGNGYTMDMMTTSTPMTSSYIDPSIAYVIPTNISQTTSDIMSLYDMYSPSTSSYVYDAGFDTGGYVDYGTTWSGDYGYDTYTPTSYASTTSTSSTASKVTPVPSDLNQSWYDPSTGTFKFRSSATGKVYTRASNASEAAMLAMLGNRGITSSNKSQLDKVMPTYGTYDPSKYNYATNALEAQSNAAKSNGNKARIQAIQDQINQAITSRNNAARRNRLQASSEALKQAEEKARAQVSKTAHSNAVNMYGSTLANASAYMRMNEGSTLADVYRQDAWNKYKREGYIIHGNEIQAIEYANDMIANDDRINRWGEVGETAGVVMVAPLYGVSQVPEVPGSLLDAWRNAEERSNVKSTQSIIRDAMNRALTGRESIFSSAGRRYDPHRGIGTPTGHYNPYATTASEQATNSAILQYEMSKYKDAKTSNIVTDAGQAQINAAIRNRLAVVKNTGDAIERPKYLEAQAKARQTAMEEAYAAARAEEVNERYFQRLEQERLAGDQYPSDGMQILGGAVAFPFILGGAVTYNAYKSKVEGLTDAMIANDEAALQYQIERSKNLGIFPNTPTGYDMHPYTTRIDQSYEPYRYQRQTQYVQNASNMWDAQSNAAIINREMVKYQTQLVANPTNASEAQSNAAIQNRLAVAKKSGTTTTKKATVSNTAKQNQKKTQAAYAAVKKSSGSTAKASATAASIAQAQAAKNRKVNKSVLTKKGKGDDFTSIFNTSTNPYQSQINNPSSMQIPPIDLSKFDFSNDETGGTYVNQYYVAPSNSNHEEKLHSILTNTYNVRAERVEELLETIIKKMDEQDKKKPSTPTQPQQPNMFPNNDIPAPVARISQ